MITQLKYFKISILVLLVAPVLLLFGSQNNNVSAEEGASDAIAVRILPNPNHYSPLDWYYKQGFNGSPTPLVVDGYEAIRDGRTVYVNVANVSGDNLYTNIYLISYNQEASPDTEKIFEQILSHWRFNNNLTTPGTCFQQENTEEVCLVDSDCDGGGFCSSVKATITRDTKRLGQIVNTREQLSRYKNNNGYYPKLESGTYLPGRTVSTWPSWLSEFGSELGISLKADPVNKLGYCDTDIYDEETCWDDDSKSFVGGSSLQLPVDSKAMIYESLNNGNEYRMCAYMESELFTNLDNSYAYGSCIQDVRGNEAPVIECGTLLGTAGSSFVGYITATDDNSRNIDLSIANSLPGGFSQEFLASDNRIKLTNPNPAPGSGSLNVVARDSNGEVSTRTCQWSITADKFITYPIPDQNVLVGKDLSFPIYVQHSEQDYQGISFSLTNDNSSNSTFAVCSRPENLEDGRRKCEISIPSSTLGGTPATYSISTNVRNHSSQATVQRFRINVYNNPPKIVTPLNCPGSVRVGSDYTACDIVATDPDGHSVSNYSVVGAPPGINIVTNNGKGVISSTPSGPSQSGEFNTCVVARDEYGLASPSACFEISVNTYCGDGVRNTPNMEGRGGRSDDGYEECDGTDGVPVPGESSISWQYGCEESQCRSLSEGYCGDGIVQGDYGETCDNNDLTCCNQCAWTTEPYVDVDININNGIIQQGERLAFNIPNRGINTIAFDASLENNFPGVAIMLLSDLSRVTENTETTEYIKEADRNVVNNFSALATLQDIDVMMGTAGFGNCANGPYCLRQDPLNLRNSISNRGTLLSSIDSYEQFGDMSGSRSGIEVAVAEGARLLAQQPSDYWKYMIVLSDGYTGARDSQLRSAAQAAKDAGVDIYMISYWDDPRGMTPMCDASSDNGQNCWGNNSYSRLSDESGSQITEILDDIVLNIINEIPNGFRVRIESYTGAYIESADTSSNSATFVLEIPDTVMNCGISGEACQEGSAELYLRPLYTGNGQVNITNMSANILNVCQG